MGSAKLRHPTATVEQEPHCRLCEYHTECSYYDALLKSLNDGWGSLTYEEVSMLIPTYDFDTAPPIEDMVCAPVDRATCLYAGMVDVARKQAKSQGNL